MDIVYRAILKGEGKKAATLESQCLSTAWSERQIEDLPENAVYIVALCGTEICGVASMYCVFGEGQIMNVAVSENYRRKGIALGLMETLFAFATEKECENITLEVAENNISAISLYNKCGFNQIGKRKNFYGNISALILEKKL